MFVDLKIIVEYIHYQLHDYANSEKKYLDTYSGEFYNESEYELLPESVIADIIQIPSDDWQTAAESFIETYFNKKKALRFKESFCIKNSDINDFWYEMGKYNLNREWRRIYAEFLFEKAKNWCLENNIHYTDNYHPHEKLFAL